MSSPKRGKRKKSILQAQIIAIIRQSLKATVDEAMKEILKGFK